MNTPPMLRYAPWVAAGVVAMLAIAAWWNQRVAFDDAYISYRYAANWVAGNGLVFNPGGERVEGFSNPLWVGIAAIAIAAKANPFVVTSAVGVASCAAALALLAYGLAHAARPLGRRAIWLTPAMGVLVLPSGLAGTAGSGLETAFVSLCLVGLGATYFIPDSGEQLSNSGWSRARRALRAVFSVAVVLTRMDAVLGVAAFAVVAPIGRGPADRHRVAGDVADAAIPATVALTVMTLARRLYYGAWLPNPFYAKGADGVHWAAGLDYVATFAWSSPQVLPLLGLGIFAIFASPESRNKRALAYALVCTVLYAIYIARVGGDFMQYRFAWQVYPLLAGAGLAGLIKLAQRAPIIAGVMAVVLALASTRPADLESSYFMQSLEEMNDYAIEGKLVGKRLRKLLPPNAVIATTLAGTIPYFSGLATVDQWGLNHRGISTDAPLSKFQRGHHTPVSAKAIEERGVELVINHPSYCSCSDPCVESASMLFIRLRGDTCLKGYIVPPNRELVARACADPANFVLHNVQCNEDQHSK